MINKREIYYQKIYNQYIKIAEEVISAEGMNGLKVSMAVNGLIGLVPNPNSQNRFVLLKKEQIKSHLDKLTTPKSIHEINNVYLEVSIEFVGEITDVIFGGMKNERRES